MTMDKLRQQISQFLGFNIASTPVPFITHQDVEEDGYRRLRISYPGEEGEQIPVVPPQMPLNTTCTRLVGLCVFPSSLRGLKWV